MAITPAITSAIVATASGNVATTTTAINVIVIMAVIMGIDTAIRVKPSKNLTLAGFVASLQNLTEVVSHLSFHVLLLAL